MTELFKTVLEMSITGAIIIAAVMLIRLCMKKLPRRYAYFLWIIPAIRLLCPLTVSSEASLFNLFPTQSVQVEYEERVVTEQTVELPETAIPQEKTPAVTVHYPEQPAQPSQLQDIVNEKQPTEEAVQRKVSAISVVSVVWLAGAAAMLVYVASSYIRTYRRIRSAALLQNNIFISHSIDTPFVFGLIKPKIYIPDGISGMDLQYILAHENAHIKRLDHVAKLLAMVILSVHWYNPLVWLGFKLMTDDMELSCDEKALGSYDVEDRKAYATTLLNMSVRQNSLNLGGMLSFGESGIKTRIKGVLAMKKPKAIACVLAVAAIIAAAVCLLTSANKIVREDVAYAEAYQSSTNALYGFEFAEIDGKAVAELLNSFKVKRISVDEIPDIANEIVYEINLYNKDRTGYDSVCFYSPVYAYKTENDSYKSIVVSKIKMRDNYPNVEKSKCYKLTDSDWEKLCNTIVPKFEAFPEGNYISTQVDNQKLCVKNVNGIPHFELFVNDECVWIFDPDSFEAAGLTAVGGNDEHTITKVHYLGNGSIDVEIPPVISVMAAGPFIWQKGLNDAIDFTKEYGQNPPVLNDGNYYLNGNKENACFAVQDGKIQLIADDKEKMRAMFEAEAEQQDNYKNIWEFEEWYEWKFSYWEEPKPYIIRRTSTGTIIGWEVNYDDTDGSILGYYVMYYIDENSFECNQCTYSRVTEASERIQSPYDAVINYYKSKSIEVSDKDIKIAQNSSKITWQYKYPPLSDNFGIAEESEIIEAIVDYTANGVSQSVVAVIESNQQFGFRVVDTFPYEPKILYGTILEVTETDIDGSKQFYIVQPEDTLDEVRVYSFAMYGDYITGDAANTLKVGDRVEIKYNGTLEYGREGNNQVFSMKAVEKETELTNLTICTNYLNDYWNYLFKTGEFNPEDYISDADMLALANKRKLEAVDTVGPDIVKVEIITNEESVEVGINDDGRLWFCFIYDVNVILNDGTSATGDGIYQDYVAYFELDGDGNIFREYRLWGSEKETLGLDNTYSLPLRNTDINAVIENVFNSIKYKSHWYTSDVYKLAPDGYGLQRDEDNYIKQLGVEFLIPQDWEMKYSVASLNGEKIFEIGPPYPSEQGINYDSFKVDYGMGREITVHEEKIGTADDPFEYFVSSSVPDYYSDDKSYDTYTYVVSSGGYNISMHFISDAGVEKEVFEYIVSTLDIGERLAVEP